MDKTMTNTRKMVLIAIFSAMGYVLMLLDFPLAFLIPSFIKFDFSELPALICAFAAGPWAGVLVCFFKNAIHLLNTSTLCVGEFANFLLGAAFVLPAGLIYKYNRTKKGALLGMLVGAAVSSIISLPINLFITYPFYINVMNFPENAILGMYKAIAGWVKNLPQAILTFNVPFNFLKYGVDAAITFVIYKRISPILQGRK